MERLARGTVAFALVEWQLELPSSLRGSRVLVLGVLEEKVHQASEAAAVEVLSRSADAGFQFRLNMLRRTDSLTSTLTGKMFLTGQIPAV